MHLTHAKENTYGENQLDHLTEAALRCDDDRCGIKWHTV